MCHRRSFPLESLESPRISRDLSDSALYGKGIFGLRAVKYFWRYSSFQRPLRSQPQILSRKFHSHFVVVLSLLSRTSIVTSLSMARISELSDEILLNILSFFGHWTTKPVLCRIALVSRRLYQLSTLCLMENIFLTPSREDGSFRKYDQLLSALKNNGHIGTKVRKLDIDWTSQKARDDLQILLNRLPNVRYLTIQAYSGQDFDYKIYVAPSSSCCEYKLSLSLNEPNNEDIRNLLVHCHVHDLDIKVIGIRNLPAISPPTTEQAQTTVLRSLKCYDQNTAALSIENLRNILLYPKALIDLSVQIPGLPETNSHSNTQMMRDALSPQAILHALSPASRTLQSLELDGIVEYFPSHDGSQLCLFDFQALKSAFISSSLILPPHELWPNLPNLLPSSLCALTVRLPPRAPAHLNILI